MIVSVGTFGIFFVVLLQTLAVLVFIFGGLVLVKGYSSLKTAQRFFKFQQVHERQSSSPMRLGSIGIDRNGLITVFYGLLIVLKR
jgi:hypothetical protein